MTVTPEAQTGTSRLVAVTDDASAPKITPTDTYTGDPWKTLAADGSVSGSQGQVVTVIDRLADNTATASGTATLPAPVANPAG